MSLWPLVVTVLQCISRSTRTSPFPAPGWVDGRRRRRQLPATVRTVSPRARLARDYQTGQAATRSRSRRRPSLRGAPAPRPLPVPLEDDLTVLLHLRVDRDLRAGE